MEQPVLTDQQAHYSRDEKETQTEVKPAQTKFGIPREALYSPHILKTIFNWLADLIQLSEEEQTDAGIYLYNQRNL